MVMLFLAPHPHTQEEYIKDEMKNLKRELIRAKEEIKRIQSVPLVIGQFNEIIDANYGIVGQFNSRTQQHWQLHCAVSMQRRRVCFFSRVRPTRDLPQCYGVILPAVGRQQQLTADCRCTCFHSKKLCEALVLHVFHVVTINKSCSRRTSNPENRKPFPESTAALTD